MEGVVKFDGLGSSAGAKEAGNPYKSVPSELRAGGGSINAKMKTTNKRRGSKKKKNGAAGGRKTVFG